MSRVWPLLLGLLIAAFIAWRYRVGTWYMSTPPEKVSRKDNPFAFWLSLIVPIGLAALFIVIGLAKLFGVED